MDLTVVEDDIKARLVAQIVADVPEIRSWPNNPADYQFIHPIGAVLLRYNGDNSETPVPNQQKKAVQLRTVSWLVGVITKNLSREDGHQGAYDILEKVRAALVGYTISTLDDASIIWHDSTQLLQEVGGTWIYTMTFTFTFPEGEA